MPLIQQQVTVLANSTIEDILVNNVLAIAPGPALIEAGLVASATGLVADVNVGTRQVAPNIRPTTQNRFPIFPEDFTLFWGVAVGDRTIIRVTNTTGGNLTLFFTLRINPR